MTLLTHALDLAHAGCCVIPARPDGSKAPAADWKAYQHQRPTEDQLIDWFTGTRYDGLGIVTGTISGNLEMLEVEGRATHLIRELAQLYEDHGLVDLWKRLRTGYVVRTPTGGVHWHYRTADAPPLGNTKLARRPSTADELAANPKTRIQVLIETRGEGGFTVTAPSNGRTHPSGKPWVLIAGHPAAIPTITAEERAALHGIARLLDQMPEPEAPDPQPRRPSATVARERREGHLRPGDDYNQRATWDEVLAPHGWARVAGHGQAVTWRRPGKTIGISATTGRNDGDNLYVFSTSTEFDPEKPYSKFAAYTLLEHGGDYQIAAKTLQAAGYGTQPEHVGAADPTPATFPEPTYDDFWTSRPVLARIRDFARARRASPWAVLAIVLLRVVMATPKFVVLPGIIGGPASLNLFVGLVGPSGSGKGAATAAARDCIDIGYIETIGIGSGEGITHSFMEYVPPKDKGEKGSIEQHTDAVLFTAAEIGTVGALVSRQASTLLDELKKAWMGEALGFGYVDKFKRLPMREHTYRLGLLAGIQPLRADALLQDTAGGTPQRWLWMPTTDPEAPAERPTQPEAIMWQHPISWPLADHQTRLVQFPVCEAAHKEIDDAQLARLQGAEAQANELDGHLLLTRLKVAAALALLDERTAVTDDDWQLAATIVAKSTSTRAHIQYAMEHKRKQINLARGKDEAERQLIVTETLEEKAIDRAVRSIKRKLKNAEWMTRSELRGQLAAGIRKHFDTAIDRLIDAQDLLIEQVEYQGQAGYRYRLAQEDQ